nr:hypothetical protein [Microvirgula aerodenitrificans]
MVEPVQGLGHGQQIHTVVRRRQLLGRFTARFHICPRRHAGQLSGAGITGQYPLEAVYQPGHRLAVAGRHIERQPARVDRRRQPVEQGIRIARPEVGIGIGHGREMIGKG